jgi:hypothetical protein
VDDDRRAVRGRLLCSLPIEVFVEDGSDGSVAEAVDVDGEGRSCLEPFTAERALKAQDADAGPEALFWMRLSLQDEVAQRRCRWPDAGGFLPDAIERPVSIALMTGWHVLPDGRVPVVAAPSHMDGNPLAFDENLHGAVSEPHLDFAAGIAVGNAVEVVLDLDMVVDADAPPAPLRELIPLYRQGLERRSIKLFQELSTGFIEATDWPFFVEAPKHIPDRRVHLREVMEDAVAQTADEPALDDEHGTFNFRLVAGTPRSCR